MHGKFTPIRGQRGRKQQVTKKKRERGGKFAPVILYGGIDDAKLTLTGCKIDANRVQCYKCKHLSVYICNTAYNCKRGCYLVSVAVFTLVKNGFLQQYSDRRERYGCKKRLFTRVQSPSGRNEGAPPPHGIAIGTLRDKRTARAQTRGHARTRAFGRGKYKGKGS